jgi:proteic killer suppression protein
MRIPQLTCTQVIALLDACKALLYTHQMIKSLAHKGLEAFFNAGSKKGIQPAHATKLKLQLAALNQARSPHDLSAPGWRLRELKGDLRGYHSITVNGNWRIIFRFVGTDVELVDYLDYH